MFFGTCPVYELTITGSGQVTFQGKEFVARKGVAKGHISPENMDTLLKLAVESGYFKIPTHPDCGVYMTDMPSAILDIRINNAQNRVVHYHGCRGFRGEEALYRLETAIDSLAEVSRWVKKP